MKSTPSTQRTNADQLYMDYQYELSDFWVNISRGGAYTAIALILFGMMLDYGRYPHLAIKFEVVRVFVSLVIAGIVVVLYQDCGRRFVSWLTFLWLLFPQVMICWMIFMADGAVSPYYVGLNLAIFAAGIAIPFGVWQNIMFGGLSCVLYIVACWLHRDGVVGQHSILLINTLLLVFASIASAVYSFFNERARFILFSLKAEVSKKNAELETINRQLLDIKGQLLQQEKMAAIGTLAAGLLHEVNNPVNFSLMAIEVAMEEAVMHREPALQECLADAKQGMQRIQHIVSDLKTFAYRKPGADADQGAPFLFEKALESSMRLTAHELRGITVTRSLPSDTLVQGDEAAIIGVLINLFSNAVLAMRKAGTVAQAIHASATWLDERLHITVRDNGPGIARENLSRVFEPFFTTRDVGQGLGLGLSISYAVIERHGGTLYAESQPGNGASFSFDLARAH